MSQFPEVRFEKLTPISDGDLGVYEKALNFIFENDDIKNVAISGAYGAGKSSVLASYKVKYNDKKYIHISLAHFVENEETGGKSDNQNESEKTIKESVLEGKILNQLIHQIPADKIPQSQFRVKKRLEKHKIVKSTLIISLYALLLAIFTLFDKWANFVGSLTWGPIKDILIHTTYKDVRFAIGIVLLGFSIFGIYKIIQIQKSRNIFRKLNVQGNEIEIFEDSDESYFDKYLNEVLYLFENADADVIVFEDMDRYNANQIFERLREVNTLSNLQRKIDNKGTLRFFYLLRDDIFSSKDRTKFFDYIVPIVPVIDSSNSYDQFISHLKNLNIYEKFDEHFLQGLSLYVDDMRLLKNICNEFLVYYNRLNTTELDCNKMLAIMTYKNLFPKDYSELQLNKGFVYAIFCHKDSFLSAQRQQLEKRIEDDKENIEMIKRENLESINELNEITVAKESRCRGGYMYGSAHTELQNWKKTLPRRQSLIEQKNNGRIEEILKEITELQNELSILGNMPLWKIITRDNIDKVFSVTSVNEIGEIEEYKEIRRSDYFALLRYLIRNGYIDETYPDYMTYFYESSLCKTDKIFLRSVTDKKAKEYSYQLKNPKLVLRHLDPLDFDQKETLNFSLLDYLLHSNSIPHLSHLLAQIQSASNYEFISQYFKVTQEMKEFIVYFNSNWPELFSLLLKNEVLTKRDIEMYSIYILYYLNDDSINEVNKSNEFKDYILSSSDYLNIPYPNIDRLLHGFSILQIYFPTIDYSVSNKELFNAIYRAGYYRININNIKLILKHIYEINDEQDIIRRTTSLILMKPDSPLSQKIKDDMPIYIKEILNACGSIICDDESASISILNDITVDRDDKIKYIGFLKSHIKSLISIADKQMWQTLIASGIVAYCEQNIMEYYIYAEKLDDAIVSFINNGDVELDFSQIEEKYREKIEELFDKIVECNAIDNRKYSTILCNMGYYYEEFSIKGIETEKVHILINKKIIRMNEASLQFIRENYSPIIHYYILEDFDEYCNLMDDNLFSFEELLFILSQDVDENQKIGLLNYANQPISIVGKDYSDRIIEFVLVHNFDQEDFSYIIKEYSHFDIKVQDIIYAIAVDNNERVISSLQIADNSLVRRIMNDSNIGMNIKLELLIIDIPNLDKETAMSYLDIVNKSEFKKVFDPLTRPRYKNDNNNQRILSAFKEKGWLFEFHVDSDGYFRIRRHETKKK